MKNYRFKRIFVIVADSMGSGYLPDADKFGDKGSNTLVHIGEKMPNGLNVPVMNAMGMGDLDPIRGTSKANHPQAFITKAHEVSNGKDTMTGHWEIMGINTVTPFKTFTDTGFPKELIDEL